MSSTLVVLAAGVGSRLRPLTDSQPKCLIEVEGHTLLDRLIRAFAATVEQTVVVAGHLSEDVKAHVARSRYGIPVTVVENTDYGTTNSLMSALEAAEEWVESRNVVFSNSDVVFAPGVIERAADREDRFQVLVSRKDCDAEDMKVKLRGETMSVAEISKGMPVVGAFGEFTGVFWARGEGPTIFHRYLLELSRSEQMRQAGWYDLGIDALAKDEVVGVTPIPHNCYAEIDTHEDFFSASALVREWDVMPRTMRDSASGHE